MPRHVSRTTVAVGVGVVVRVRVGVCVCVCMASVWELGSVDDADMHVRVSCVVCILSTPFRP